MNNFKNHFSPLPKDFFVKMSLLKSMMYCGVLWGLYYNNGWAILSNQDDHIFPFWLSPALAKKHAERFWPNYTPRKITSNDFQESLLPTLNRLNIVPALYSSKSHKFKFSSQLMQYFFFNNSQHAPA